MSERDSMPYTAPLFRRLRELDRPSVAFYIDGKPKTALAGDTVLTAMLNSVGVLRADAEGLHAGFCLMGACQDCWVDLEGGGRVRGCSTPVQAGMRLVTCSTERR